MNFFFQLYNVDAQVDYPNIISYLTSYAYLFENTNNNKNIEKSRSRCSRGIVESTNKGVTVNRG